MTCNIQHIRTSCNIYFLIHVHKHAYVYDILCERSVSFAAYVSKPEIQKMYYTNTYKHILKVSVEGLPSLLLDLK